ncbi:hypothetical protein PAHAL_3G472500 [Panicum hallii]|uniref:DUF6598 domain-containing protein n=1 Tax=Panicum hallii TaxID=206008 RepID=A0A2T8KLN7_9POAL|nr:hypothetical protein PAHAL_3G472500 [Panicum hallii]
METEEGGGSSVTSSPGGSDKSRQPSPPTPPDGDEDSSESTSIGDGDEWLVSDEDADCENTVDDFPRFSCGYEEQNHLLYRNPDIKLRGPSPIRLYPAFKYGKHVFGSDYNLGDKSGIINYCKSFLLQFIDIKIARYHHTWPGPAKIFGFVAARDTIEPLRNYVYRREINSSEDEYGVARLSLTSPARVISMASRALIEFELRVRTEGRPDEDEPNGDCLIEGCTELTNMLASDSFIEHRRLYGDNCALDVKFAVLINAVEARVDIKVLSLGAIASGINLKVYGKTSGFSEVIRLFEGASPKPGVVMSFAVAVDTHNYLDVCIEGSSEDNPVLGRKEKKPASRSWWKCSFGSDYHDMDKEVAELGEFAVVSVNVNWKSYRKKESLRE